jgi:hypothetical protein
MNLALAVKYGTNESLFLTNLCFWIEKNKANRVHYHDGHYWVYNTMEAWAELFPYFSKDQIRRLINKMKSQAILLVGVYNRIHYDRTQWYSVSDEVMALYLGGYKKGEPGQGEQRKDEGERQEPPKSPDGKTGNESVEPAGEKAAMCPPGPMDAAEVPHPSAPGGAWMRRNRHMEAADSPDGSGGIATTIPYIKPIYKPAAAAAEEIPKGQMAEVEEKPEKAAAGFFDIEKLKAALTGIHRELVFDEFFYPKALAYLAARGFDNGYLFWLYGECRKRNPENMRGLYYTLFAKEDMAALYRAAEKERHTEPAPVRQKTCPCCGTAHPACLERCPECELEKADEGDPAKIARQRKFYRLPREVKDEYAKEHGALFSQALTSGMPFEETKAQWIMLEKKYHLLE